MPIFSHLFKCDFSQPFISLWKDFFTLKFVPMGRECAPLFPRF
jgi:hypothetical protein